MRYRGGGIGHGYMRDVETRFEDMKREQVDPEPVQLPKDGGDGTGESPAEPEPSAVNVSKANVDDDGSLEEDDYHGGGESKEYDDDEGESEEEDDSEDDYDMGEY